MQTSSAFNALINSALPPGTHVTRAQRSAFICLVLRYAFRQIDVTQFTHGVKDIVPTASPKHARSALRNSGTLLLNMKTYAYASAAGRVNYAKFNLDSDTAADVRRALASSLQLMTALRGLLRRGYKAVTPTAVDDVIGRVIRSKEITDYTARFVYKKLKFVYQGQGLTPDDIYQDLYLWGVYALYRAYPRIDSMLHATNIVKQAIHNRGINLIKEATAASRSRFHTSADGTHSSVVVPLHSMLSPTLDGGYLTQTNHLVVNQAGVVDAGTSIAGLEDDRDLKLSVRFFYAKISPLQRKLMKLWSGSYCSDFSAHLGSPNDEYADSTDRFTYMKACADFLGVPRGQARSLYISLRAAFKDYAPR